MISGQKADIRKRALRARDKLTEEQRTKASLTLPDYADELNIKSGQRVAGFLPIRSEMDLRPLMSILRKRGADLCLPVVLDKETIEFRDFAQDAPLEPSGFGTYGPIGSADVVDPDVLLVPLAAFDNLGNRVGYGGGYYDRAIAKLRAKGNGPHLIGIAFECQRVENVPTERHDVQLCTVLTEKGLHRFAR